MNKYAATLACLLVLTACSQITTNDQERAVMQRTADAAGDVYVECIRSQALRDARVALSQATGQVIANGLDLLGVSAPEEM